MRVRWQQIDPRVAAIAGARLRNVAPEVEQTTTSILQRSDEERSTASAATEATAVYGSAIPVASLQTQTRETGSAQTLEPVWSVFSLCMASCIVALYFIICFHLGGPLTMALLTLLPLGCMVSMAALPGRAASASSLHTGPPRGLMLPDERLRYALMPAEGEVQETFPRAERLYSEIVYFLVTGAARGRDARRGRTLLRECNTLLAEHYRMEAEKHRVQALLDHETAAATRAETEREGIIARLEAESDPIARKSLSASLELCDERRESIRSLRPLLTRMEAHQEVIYQALALTRAALAREQAVPVSLALPDVTRLRQTVRNVLHETRAVEEAVTELAEW